MRATSSKFVRRRGFDRIEVLEIRYGGTRGETE
jgi:hypothetical protein